MRFVDDEAPLINPRASFSPQPAAGEGGQTAIWSGGKGRQPAYRLGQKSRNSGALGTSEFRLA